MFRKFRPLASRVVFLVLTCQSQHQPFNFQTLLRQIACTCSATVLLTLLLILLLVLLLLSSIRCGIGAGAVVRAATASVLLLLCRRSRLFSCVVPTLKAILLSCVFGET